MGEVVTTGVNAPERLAYHKWIEKFKNYLNPHDTIYDIGCFSRHDYHETMRDYYYSTVDKDVNQSPDILLNIETHSLLHADGIMCHGVHSECANPFNLTKGCYNSLKSGGIALFGIVLLGYPEYDGEYWRFTQSGAKKLFDGYFDVLQDEVYFRSIPSFYFSIVRKK